MKDQRNELAKIRTKLANSRTLLSYLRTALAMFGVGAFLFKFYENDFIQSISFAIAVVSVVIFIIGLVHYVRTQRKIDY
jgi:putative membrane protein